MMAYCLGTCRNLQNIDYLFRTLYARYSLLFHLNVFLRLIIGFLPELSSEKKYLIIAD